MSTSGVNVRQESYNAHTSCTHLMFTVGCLISCSKGPDAGVVWHLTRVQQRTITDRLVECTLRCAVANTTIICGSCTAHYALKHHKRAKSARSDRVKHVRAFNIIPNTTWSNATYKKTTKCSKLIDISSTWNIISSMQLTLNVLNFWKLTSYCSLKPLWSGMGEVVPARTSPTLYPRPPPTVHQLSWLAL